ncbi:MAG: hypothetical protein HFI90_06225 [Clostridia bacterium]|nr:hypothetical protein [Clostridia bacterium]
MRFDSLMPNLFVSFISIAHAGKNVQSSLLLIPFSWKGRTEKKERDGKNYQRKNRKRRFYKRGLVCVSEKVKERKRGAKSGEEIGG